jgi:hypothetical protein
VANIIVVYGDGAYGIKRRHLTPQQQITLTDAQKESLHKVQLYYDDAKRIFEIVLRGQFASPNYTQMFLVIQSYDYQMVELLVTEVLTYKRKKHKTGNTRKR